MEFRQVRNGSSVSLSVGNGKSVKLPTSFFSGAESSDGVIPGGDGSFTVAQDSVWEFEFAAEAVWQAGTFGSSDATTEGFWVLWRNGAEDSGPVPNGSRMRVRLNAGDVVQPAPYATGIEGSTSGNPAPVNVNRVGGLAHWTGHEVP